MDSSDYRPFIDITNRLNDFAPFSASPVLSDGDIESDITDTNIILQRSPSRLGFNFTQGSRDVIAAQKDAEVEKQAKLEWINGLFQRKIRDSDAQEQEPLCVDLALSSSNSSELGDDSEFSSDDSDEDEPARVIPFPGPTLRRSISSSHLPLAKEPPARPPSAPFLFPVSNLSPLSPHHPGTQTPSTSPNPLELNHHGLSKSALMHQKWFWSTRHDEWATWEAQMEEADVISDAYGGMAILPGTCPALSRSRYTSTRRTQPSSPCPSPNPANPRIFPRLGDISALRDPYSVNIDRCFCHFPLWTVHKTLYMFDMHHRSTSLHNTSKMNVGESEGLSNAVNMDKQASDATGSNDRDAILVSEEVLGSSVTRKAFSGKGSDIDEFGESGEFQTWDGVRAWEISWYARWELLIELVKRDEVKRNVLGCVVTCPHEPPPMFFFAGENSKEDDDDEEEEEEDYGTIVSNPLYGRPVHVGFGGARECFANENIDLRSGMKMICV